MKVEDVEMGVVVQTPKIKIDPRSPFTASWSGKVVKVMPRAKVVVIEFLVGRYSTVRERVRVPFGTDVVIVPSAKEFFSSFGTYKYS